MTMVKIPRKAAIIEEMLALRAKLKQKADDRAAELVAEQIVASFKEGKVCEGDLVASSHSQKISADVEKIVTTAFRDQGWSLKIENRPTGGYDIHLC